MTSENRLHRSPPLSRNRDFRQMASVFEPSIIRNVWIWPWAKGNHFISTKIALSYWWPEVLSCHKIASCTLQELEIQRKVWYCRLSTCKGLNQSCSVSPLRLTTRWMSLLLRTVSEGKTQVTAASPWTLLSCENPGRSSLLWWKRSTIWDIPVNI